MDGTAAFAARLDLPIRDLSLLEQALTHSSWVHEHPGDASGHNERLELLGDAVVNLAIATALHERHPNEDEGALSARRAAIVSAQGLSRLADRVSLGGALRLGQGEERGGGRTRPLLLASAFEAVAGALYLDQGWQPTRDWVIELARPEIEADEAPASLKSPKSRLQELTQRASLGRPVYDLVESTGPDHRRRFVIRVAVDGVVRGAGEGASRRAAETIAAAEAVVALEAHLGRAGVEPPDPHADAAPAGPEATR